MELGGKIKHVGLELMRATATASDKPEAGLFRGIRTRTENNLTLKLVLLGYKNKPDNIKALNAEIFNIMTMTLVYGQTKEMIVFKNSKEDQKQAYEMLDEVVKLVQKDGLMLSNDPDIVDVSKYEDVPDEFFAAQKEAEKSTGAGSTGVYSKTSHNTNTQSDWQKKQEEEKKEKERQEKLRWTPFLISRKTDKPQIKDLNAIKKKIAAIASGEFNRELPELAGDDDDKDEKPEDKKTNQTGAVG